ISILQQPSATSFAGVHLTLGCHFDMDEIFSHLISKKLNKGKTTPYVMRAFEPKAIHQRTFFFVFKYYTVVDDGFTPSAWQRHGSVQTASDEDAINISECSSIVALSLEGDVVDQVSRRASKSNRVKMGSVFETFAPFHILSIQCFPDGIASDRVLAETTLHSGPQAFLECLAMEYRTAVQRLWKLNERIASLVIPPDEFMFDLKLRDQLLFEDADFTFSRRYFWAYNSLAMVNDNIGSMLDAYADTFTSSFWLGQHPTLWPHPDPDSLEGVNYLARLATLRHDLEASLRELRALIKSNEQLRREIDNLREQLYSGSSVKENRTTIEQGENIKILTGVSMLFMPLTFVTSVFSMQAFHIPPTDWRFVVMMISICVPFFVLVFILQT
ncbi:cora-like Mg2+ transporter protein-domain-containing protein, partial [Coniella lustricola]